MLSFLLSNNFRSEIFADMNLILKFMLFFLIAMLAINCDDTIVQEMEEEVEIIVADALSSNGGCPDTLSPFYIEKDGLLSLETESADFAGTSWKLDSLLSGYSGKGYLVWNGDDNFNKPGIGLLNFRIRITNPGTYRFSWKSRIAAGSSNTDFNDSWLRIPDADHFYAKTEDGRYVYPKGSTQPPVTESSGQSNTTPEGSGSNGWFKVYMNTLGKWWWRSTTSDNDPHFIYAVFKEAGDFTVQISGRSKSHAIDKFVLYRQDISKEDATSNSLSEIVCE